MSKVKDSGKTELVTITGMCNTVDIEQGDRLQVRITKDFQDGDLVVFEDLRAATGWNSGMRARYFYHSKGRVYAFYGRGRLDTRYGVGRENYRAHEVRIIGVVEKTPSRKSDSPATGYLEQNILKLHKENYGVWDFLTGMVQELCEAAELALWSQPIIAMVVQLASQRIERGERYPGMPLEHEGRARQVLKDFRRTVEAIQRNESIPDEILHEYGAERVNTATESKLEALRERLETLQRRDEITDSTAIFKVEQQIYDLEHPAEDTDSILDAEVIGGRGFTNREGGA